MANRYANLPGAAKIKDTYDRINQGFDLVEQDVDQLRADLDQEIADREAAVEYVDQRVDNIIVGGGPDKDPELVDIRNLDPSYTPQREINVAGDVTRDMQAQFAAHKAKLDSIFVSVEEYGAIGDGVTDDTAAFQSAIDNAPDGATIFIPGPKTYILRQLSVNKNLRFLSFNGATLKFPDGLNTNTTMIKIIQNGIQVAFEGITFDGNKNNITEPNSSNLLRYRIIEYSLPQNQFVARNSFLHVEKCRFINTPSNAIFLGGYDDTDKTSESLSLIANIENNYFEKGFENAPGYLDTNIISIMDNVVAFIERNEFIKNEDISLYGLGAITITTNDTNVEVFSSVTIRDNVFVNYGRQGATGLGPIGVIDFYASNKKLIIDGNKFINSYSSPIKGKSDSELVIITKNIIDGALINERTTAKIFGIEVNRGTHFAIKGKFVVDGNIIKNIYGNGIVIVGANSSYAPAPTGKMYDVIVQNNIVDIIKETGTTSMGIYILNFENVIVNNNILKNNTVGIYLNNFKTGATISGNQIYNTDEYFITFIGYNTGEPGYTDYDCDVIVQGNLMRTTIPSGFSTFRCIYLEKLSNAVVTDNVARILGTQSAQNFLRTGSDVLGSVSAHNNLAQGNVTNFFGIISGTLVKSNNLLNGTLVP